MSNESAKALRKVLSKNKSKKVADGSIVRFVSGGTYTYAALFVAGRWYLTGNGYYFGGNVFTNEQFIESVLGGCDEGSVEMAVEFEDVG